MHLENHFFFCFKPVFLLVMAVAFTQTSYAQLRYNYSYVSNESGLTNNSVQSIVQDSTGYIWLGTKYGLNRYDGYKTKAYLSRQDDPESVIYNWVDHQYVDHLGILWVLNWEGMSRFDPRIDGFVHYPLDSIKIGESIQQKSIYASEDKDGHLWILTQRGRLYKYLREKDRFQYVKTTNPKNSNVSSMSFDVDDKNILWLGYTNGLLKYNLKTDDTQFFPIGNSKDLINNNIHDIIPDGDYLYLAVYESGIHRFDRKKLIYKSYAADNKISNLILSGIKDSKGRIWFTYTRGVYLLNKARDVFEEFGEYGEGGIIDPEVHCITEDRQGNIWLGTNNKGSICIAREKNFHQIDAKKFSGDQSFGNVNAINQDKDGNLWIGMDSELIILDRELNLKQFLAASNKEKTLGEGTVFTIHKDKKEQMWVGTYLGGLQKYNALTREFTSFNRNNSVSGAETRNDVRSIAEDAKGNFWLAVHGLGVSYFNTKDENFTNFDHTGMLVNNNWTNHIALDGNENVWVASYSGLTCINGETRASRPFAYERGDSASLSHEVAQTIFMDSHKRVWFGTNEGLNLFLPETNTFRYMRIDDGLANDHIAAIIEDDRGFLWVSTQGGLMKIDKETWIKDDFQHPIVTSFDKTDGLHTNQFNYRAVFKDGNGRIYFGGEGGITYFHPDSIRFNDYKPPIIIDEVRLFNSTEKADVLKKDWDGGSLSAITLEHGQNVVTFCFSAFNYVHPQENQYTYMMEGFDKGWYEVGSMREATYTNLPAGEYVFSVKASNNDGVWNEAPATLNVIVRPPWWNTILFKVLMVAAILLLMQGVFWIRSRQMIIQKDHLEELINEKTKETEAQYKELQHLANKVHESDQAKISFYMNMSHELKTPLSLIIGPVEELLRRTDFSADDRKFHTFIHRNAIRLLRLINELLDLRKLEVKEKRLSLIQGDIVKKTQQIFESFDFTANRKGLNYDYIHESQYETAHVWFDEGILEKTVYNLLSNAFKHTSKGHVMIKSWFSQDDKHFCLSVSDTGSGIPESQLDNVFNRFFSYQKDGYRSEGTGIGLTLVKELVNLHRGEIEVQSKDGEGSTFTLKICVDKAAFENADVTGKELVGESRFLSDAAIIQNFDHDQDVEIKDNSTVLLVEDNVDFRSYVSSSIQSDYNIILADNGKTGLEKLHDFDIDLIVSDIMMPVMDGKEFCQKVKESEDFSHIPVILLTAKSSEDSRVEGYNVGADAFISKPFEMKVLKSRINNLIANRRQLQRVFNTESHHGVVETNEASNKNDQLLDQMIKIVEENLSNPNLGYAQFVEALGMSKTKLYRIIGELTGQSINLFIRNIRLKTAAKMFETLDLSISEVSYKVGFNDPNYFSKCFKSQYGVAPREYVESLK